MEVHKALLWYCSSLASSCSSWHGIILYIRKLKDARNGIQLQLTNPRVPQKLLEARG